MFSRGGLEKRNREVADVHQVSVSEEARARGRETLALGFGLPGRCVFFQEKNRYYGIGARLDKWVAE
eukprot:1161272-Amorphochlora_amoeboformis.AAC.1